MVRVSVPDDIGWRPDFFLEARWRRRFAREQAPDVEFWQSNLPPIRLKIRGSRRRSPDAVKQALQCRFTVYYPVEVKSGRKKTLTANQAAVIPRVVDEITHVHPIIASVDTQDLPDSYAIDVEKFSESGWSDGETSRHQ